MKVQRELLYETLAIWITQRFFLHQVAILMSVHGFLQFVVKTARQERLTINSGEDLIESRESLMNLNVC